jgi:CDP-diacylglycerol--glycerol-3-phosphate 3-phosphatidyltransferase
MNLPNQLTLARVVMAPVFVALLSFHHWPFYLAAYAVFVAATITDYYDGKIARERNLVTNFGKLLDPVADKVLLMSGFIMLMTIPSIHGLDARILHIPGWTVVAILSREFLVTGMRALAAHDGAVIAADNYGKAKTVMQIVYVLFFLGAATLEPWAAWLLPAYGRMYSLAISVASYVAIVLVAVYTVYSGVQFMRVNWQALGLSLRQ